MWFPDWPRPARITAAFVVALSGALYLPSLSGQLIWDDHFLVDGQAIGGGRSLAACFTKPFLFFYYRPFVSASFFLDRLAWRNTPFGFHQTNILIHGLTTILVMAFMKVLFRGPAPALWAGALFAAQPAQVSTVAWIGGRTDSLCALFVAAFAYFLAKGVSATGWRRGAFISSAISCYIAAILTKEQMLAAVPLIPLAFYCFDRNRAAGWRGAARGMLSRASVGAAAAGVAASLAFVALWLTFGPPHEAVTMPGTLSQFAVGLRTITNYSLLLATPSGSSMHQLCLVSLERAGAWPIAAGGVLVVMAVITGIRWLTSRPEAAWIVWLGGLTILPVSNFIPLPSLLIAPYRAGVTGLAAAMLAGWVLGQGFRSEEQEYAIAAPARRRQARAVFGVTGAVLLLWHAGLTAWGAGQWKDERTLFSSIVHYDPYSIIARMNLTTALLQHQETSGAILHLEALMDELFRSGAWRTGPTASAAIRSDTAIEARIRENQGNRVSPEEWLAAIYAQLGFARLDHGDTVAARQVFEAGSCIYQSGGIRLGLGDCAYREQDYPLAERYFRQALSAKDIQIEVRTKLGKALAAQGKWKEARDMFAACVAAQPWAGQAYLDLADAQKQLGDRNGAAATLREALRRSPQRTDIQQMLARY